MLPKPITALLLSCAICFAYSASMAQEKIYFEPRFATGAKQSDLITCNGVVIFEETPESRFDAYSRIIATKNFFAVCDYSAKAIVVFDKTGRFVKKIKTKLDLGRLEYNPALDRLEMISPNKMFQLTSKDRAQILEDYKNPKNYKYYHKYYIDFADTLHFAVHKQKIEGLDILNPIDYTDGMHIVNQVTVDKNFGSKQDYELKIYRGDSLLRYYFPFDKQKDSRYIFDGATLSVSYASAPDSRWVTRPYDYTIYSLTKDSLYKIYNIVLPAERAVPEDFFKRDFQNRTEKDNYIRQNRKLVKQLYVYNVSSRYLSMTMVNMGFGGRNQYIFDIQKKQFFDIGKLMSDSATLFMPVCENLHFSDGAAMYARINAEEALRVYEAHKNDSAAFPPKLLAYLAAATSTSNPILINFTYRK
ncbi:MAG: hypothetical protein U0V75_06030 [Ferruginibacter sp.]